MSRQRYIIRATIIAVLVVTPLFLAGLRLIGVAGVNTLFWAYAALLSLSLTVVVGSRVVLLRRFEQGMHHLQRAEWEEAIIAFEDYLTFLQANPLFDRYHWLFMLTADATTLTVMTLCNLGYAHAQAGRYELATAFYQRALERDPDNRAAQAALEELESRLNA